MFPPRQALRPIGGLATALTALLIGQMALLTFEIIEVIHRASLLDAIWQGHIVDQFRIEAGDNAIRISGHLLLATFIATIVVWCMWQHRAHANAVDLNRGGLQFTAGWAVGWWFIPFANLVKPFQTMRELWKASHMGRWQALPTWVLIGWWWGVWLGSSLRLWIGSNGLQAGLTFGTSDQQLSLQDFLSRDRWTIAWLALRVMAGALAIVVVRSIVRLQAKADAARSIVPVPLAPVIAVPGFGPPLPPPPAAPAGVTDAPSTGELVLIVGVLAAMVMLAGGGIAWSARDQPLAVAAPVPTRVPTPVPTAVIPPASPSETVVQGFGKVWTQEGVTLRYPKGWGSGDLTAGAQVGSPPLWIHGFGPNGHTDIDVVTVSGYALSQDASSLTDEQRSAAVAQLVADVAGELNGTVTSDVNTTVFGGELAGYHVTADVTVDGQPVLMDLNALFVGSVEYTIACQSTPAARVVISVGCAQIRTTFKVTR